MKCVINPKTGKPYTKHKFTTHVSVHSYTLDRRPASYLTKITCEREGCEYQSHGSY